MPEKSRCCLALSLESVGKEKERKERREKIGERKYMETTTLDCFGLGRWIPTR
jgi:hypothetical protein